MDRPGELCEALGMANTWELIREASSKRQFSLSSKPKPGFSKNFTFAPEFAVFGATWVDGVELSALSEDPTLRDLFACLDTVREFGDIKELRRCGLRFIALDAARQQDVAVDGDAGLVLLDQFLERSCESVSGGIRKTAGDITDASVKIVGKHKDEMHYTISYGPFGDFEAPKFFSDVADNWPEASGYDLLCDADFWEANFAMTTSARKWALPVMSRFREVATSVSNGIRGNGNG
ncbi:hypothetical protein JLDANKMP_00948 [Stenotrophomonas sp. PE591]|nr:hypothetical protein [Stenotrophomonas sp. PE591]